MTRILGIDPGSRLTGYGVIDSDGQHARYVGSGCLRVNGATLADKLGLIFRELHTLIGDFQPEQLAIESVFMHRNADSALKLGQARGAAICAAVTRDLPVAEYAPREIKQALVGTGAASKEQVQHMVRRLLGIQQELQADEADGLAIAICHAQFHASRQKTGIDAALLKRRRGRRR